MNRLWCLLLLFTLFCQRDTPNADELLPVTSLAVWQEDREYRLLLEGARQSTLEGNAEAVYLEAAADTPEALFDEAQAVFAEHLTFMHTSLLLVDPSLSVPDIGLVCQTLLDGQGAPRTAYLVCAAGEDADRLLEHEHPVEELPGLGLRDLLRAAELEREQPPIATLADGKALFTGSPLSLPTLTVTDADQIVYGGELLIGGTGGAT